MAQILGIDFGTTNTVVALSDRGSFPIVQHTIKTRIGKVSHDVYPSTIFFSRQSGKFAFGLEAERLAQQSSESEGIEIRSIKRVLSNYYEGMEHAVPERFKVKDLLVGFLGSLRESIMDTGLFKPGEVLQTVITWPAHSNGAQRAVTREAFREAGFEVIGTLNEPTAAAIEYADRATNGNPRAARSFSETVAVFDFGGGTFDASLLSICNGIYQVLDTLGLDSLGGDDLDRVLAGLFAERLSIEFDSLEPRRRMALIGLARTQKESLGTRPSANLHLHPHDIGLEAPPVFVSADEYIEKIKPLVRQTVDRLAQLTQRSVEKGLLSSEKALDAIYLVGGSSKLPLVQQLVTERFPGIRVVTTHKPFSSIAVGSAISATRKVEIRDIFSRHFGLFRLLDHGRREYFHTIFEAGTRLPRKGQPSLEKVTLYSPRHNIGHLRFLECSELDADGLPKGKVREWTDILFPYDPSLDVQAEVTCGEICAADALDGTQVEEIYRCDADGVITVEMNRLVDGKKRRFEISRE